MGRLIVLASSLTVLVSCSVKPMMHADGFYGLEVTVAEEQESDPPSEVDGDVITLLALAGLLLAAAKVAGTGAVGD